MSLKIVDHSSFHAFVGGPVYSRTSSVTAKLVSLRVPCFCASDCFVPILFAPTLSGSHPRTGIALVVALYARGEPAGWGRSLARMVRRRGDEHDASCRIGALGSGTGDACTSC